MADNARPGIITLLLVIPWLAFAVASAGAAAGDVAPKEVSFSGGDGNGCERAVVIRGAKGARDLVASEKAWLVARHPGYKFRDTTVETRSKRTFEEIVIETAAGERKVVCFDITEGFGSL